MGSRARQGRCKKAGWRRARPASLPGRWAAVEGAQERRLRAPGGQEGREEPDGGGTRWARFLILCFFFLDHLGSCWLGAILCVRVHVASPCGRSGEVMGRHSITLWSRVTKRASSVLGIIFLINGARIQHMHTYSQLTSEQSANSSGRGGYAVASQCFAELIGDAESSSSSRCVLIISRVIATSIVL